MTPKGENCFTCTRAELLAAMKAGSTLHRSKFGYFLHLPWNDAERCSRELHPRESTVRKLKREGVIECFDDGHESIDAYRLS